MTTVDALIERNEMLATRAADAGTLMPSLPVQLPNVRAIVIGCADMRVDPVDVFGLEPGEAVVIRNIGGRVTPSLFEQLSLLGRIGEVAAAVPGGGGAFDVIVLQHTDCGMTRLADSPELLAPYFGIARDELGAKAVRDPRKAVAVDVAALRATNALPPAWTLSGLVYDVSTGRVDVVVPPAPVGPG